MKQKFRGQEFDAEALRARYDAERDKRMRADGNDQYVHLHETTSNWLDDPYTPRIEREAVTRDVEVLIMGGGFAALLAAGRLREAGIDDLLMIEKAGDFGGTWYWNRYPGAACDVESYIYLPLLEATGYMPTEKYARGPEIYEYSQMIGRRFGLYERTLFQTRIHAFRWDAAISRWRVETDRGDAITARFVVICPGHYQNPKLPGIPGVETFKGHAFHTSRWDYGYTGGDSHGAPLEKLADKTVAIIGTGATAVQCVPHLGASAKKLYVFQRTPSAVDVRNDHPTDPEWFRSLAPGWQRERMDNFNLVTTGLPADNDQVDDSWTRVTFEAMCQRTDVGSPQWFETSQLNDFAIMEMVRKRVDEIVKDKETAEVLKPWYNRLCKRPCFHDDYLPTFNRSNVQLVDTAGRGVQRITESGLAVDGIEYPVDCIVYATGFDVTPYAGFSMPVFGRDELSLNDKWNKGATTLHGFHVNQFPNMFIVSTTQSAWGSNFPHMMDEQAHHVAYIVKEIRDRGAGTVEVTSEGEAAWVAHHEELAINLTRVWSECTPSYFNNEGQVSPILKRNGGYGGGVDAFIHILAAWRKDGSMAGLELG
jgi:cyclohexanone monooxygenase